MQQYEYTYRIGLRLFSPSPEIDLREEPWHSAIRQAIRDYNASTGPFNPKHLDEASLQAEKSQMTITLYSTAELSVPGRALRHFSQLVVQSGRFASALSKGKLFITFPVVKTPAPNAPLLEPETVSDADFLKALCDYFVGRAETDKNIYRKKRKAITEMKAIALEAGIIQVHEEA